MDESVGEGMATVRDPRNPTLRTAVFQGDFR